MTNHCINKPVILLTGGSQGLGFELAKRLLELGFAVSFCARNASSVASTMERLRDLGDVEGFTGDICDPSVQQLFVDLTLKRFGRIDGVVNNASSVGDIPMPDVLDSSAENNLQVFTTNVFAPLALLKKSAPALFAQVRALTIGISSDAAIQGYGGWGIYGASKAALDAAHHSLAKELQDTGVHVYSVDPGDMATAMHEAAEPEATGLRQPVDVARQMADLFIPLLHDGDWTFPTGSRIQVQETRLVAVR
jgi:NAD(P)-dependent dehydrogenase (short-subunit alcohol dehydrogenase family)